MKQKRWSVWGMLLLLILPLIISVMTPLVSLAEQTVAGEGVLVDEAGLKVSYHHEMINKTQARWVIDYEKNHEEDKGKEALHTRLVFQAQENNQAAGFEGHSEFQELGEWLIEKDESAEVFGTSHAVGTISFITEYTSEVTLRVNLAKVDEEGGSVALLSNKEHLLKAKSAVLDVNDPVETAKEGLAKETTDGSQKKTSSDEESATATTSIPRAARSGINFVKKSHPNMRVVSNGQVFNIEQDFEGWPIQLNNLYIRNGKGEWIEYPYDPDDMPMLTDESDVRLDYQFDLETFYLTKAGKQIYTLTHPDNGQEKSFEFEFEISGKIAMEHSEENKKINASIDGVEIEIGTFDIVKNGSSDGTNHLWKVRLNTDALTHSRVSGKMHFETTLKYAQIAVEEELLIAGFGEKEINVPIKYGTTKHSVDKNASKGPAYETVAGQKLALVQWTATMIPARDKDDPTKYEQIRNLSFFDEDRTKLYTNSGSSTAKAGFYFPDDSQKAELENLGYTFFEIRYADGDKETLPASAYQLKYSLTADGRVDIAFNGDLPQRPLEFTYTTILKDSHPREITNLFSGRINWNNYEALATVTLAREHMAKQATDLGQGKVQWDLYYHRQGTSKGGEFLDTISAGKIDYSSFIVKDEKGIEVFNSKENWKYKNEYKEMYESQNLPVIVTKKSEQEFLLAFSEKLPEGRYHVSYTSDHVGSVASIKNTLKPSDGQAIESQVKEGIFVTKKVLEQTRSYTDSDGVNKTVKEKLNVLDKSILWRAEISSPPTAEDILITDAAVHENKSAGLHYYYHETAKGDISDNGEPTTDYLKAKGLVLMAKDAEGNYSEISLKTLKSPEGSLEDGESYVKVISNSKADGAGIESTGNIWEGGHAGFQLHIDKKHTGQTLLLYVATKFGDVDPTEYTPPENKNIYHNVIEAKQGADKFDWSKADTGHNTEYHRSQSIQKIGQADFDKEIFNWELIMNNRGLTIKPGDKIYDNLNKWNNGEGADVDNVVSGSQYYSPEDVKNIKIYAASPHQDWQAGGIDTGLDMKLLTEGKHYDILWKQASKNPQSDEYGAFEVTFKEGFENKAIAIKVSTHYRDYSASELKDNHRRFLNTASQKLSGLYEEVTKCVDESIYLEEFTKKSLGYNKDEHRIDWQMVVNPYSQRLTNLVIKDGNEDQYIDTNPDYFKVYIGKIERYRDGTYMKERVVSTGQELDPQLYELVPAGAGFKITTRAGKKIDVPLVLEYSSIPTTTTNPEVVNKASVKWDAIEEQKVTVTQRFREQSAGGEGTLTQYTLQVAKQDAVTKEALPNARFALNQWIDGRWEEVMSLPTGENGLLTFNKLLIGRYQLVEMAAPEGYILTGEAAYFNIEKNAETNQIFMDERKEVPATDYKIAQSEGSTLLQITAANTREPTFTASKELVDDEEAAIKETFHFRLIDRSDQDRVVAFGKSSPSRTNQKAEIAFFEDEDYQQPINNWQGVLLDKHTYRLEEVENTAYDVSYQGPEGDSQEFTVDLSQGQTVTYKVTNKLKPRGVLPRTGGTGIYLLLAVGLTLILGAGAVLLAGKRQEEI